MYRQLIGMLFIGSALLTSCGSSDKGKTESGLSYEFIEKKSTSTLDSGMVATVNLSQYLFNKSEEGTDTIMNNTPKKPVPVNIMGAKTNLLMEGFQMMGEGDSAVFTGPASKVFKQGLPPSVPETAEVYCEARIVKVYENADAYRVVMEQEQEERNAEEDEMIAKYLEDNNIDAEMTESGMAYVITEEGSGETPDQGDLLQVHYTGKLLDGTKFDSSLDRGKPIEFPVGQRGVIQGWDEALMMMKEGTKATLIIPSRLAYGPRQMGDVIAPNSILLFDVEFIENKGPAPKRGQRPPMGAGQ